MAYLVAALVHAGGIALVLRAEHPQGEAAAVRGGVSVSLSQLGIPSEGNMIAALEVPEAMSPVTARTALPPSGTNARRVLPKPLERKPLAPEDSDPSPRHDASVEAHRAMPEPAIPVRAPSQSATVETVSDAPPVELADAKLVEVGSEIAEVVPVRTGAILPRPAAKSAVPRVDSGASPRDGSIVAAPFAAQRRAMRTGGPAAAGPVPAVPNPPKSAVVEAASVVAAPGAVGIPAEPSGPPVVVRNTVSAISALRDAEPVMERKVTARLAARSVAPLAPESSGETSPPHSMGGAPAGSEARDAARVVEVGVAVRIHSPRDAGRAPPTSGHEVATFREVRMVREEPNGKGPPVEVATPIAPRPASSARAVERGRPRTSSHPPGFSSSVATKAPGGTATGRPRAPGGADGGVRASYAARIRAWLEKHKRYPRRARLRRQTGTALLYFEVDRSGRVHGYDLRKSTGNDLLDRELAAMIARAQPLPGLPEAIGRERLELLLPIEFRLR